METASSFKSLIDTFRQNRKGLFRLWVTLAGIHITSLLLGSAIFLIVFGVEISVRRIFIYWAPARYWLAKTFDLTISINESSNVSPFYKIFVNIFHAAIALLFFALGFYAIKFGVDILWRDGFLGQNFIYLIFFRER